MATQRKIDPLDELIQELSDVYGDADTDLKARLHRDLVINALKYRRADLDILDLKLMNRSMAEFRYAARVFKPYRDRRKVSVFGSARTPEGNPYYKMAVEFSREVVNQGFMVITGAADGIMKAGNEGAGAANSFGANILLPAEQNSNTIIAGDPKLVTFRYFFTRKLFFLMEAHAFALFPGGFGTHDEGFETLTLVQTGKAPPMPIVMMELPGEDYWESWDGFIRGQMLRRGLISEADLSIYRIAHSPIEGARYLADYYSTYHSLRQVRDQLVVRLEHELSDEAVEELNTEFADLVKEGRIEKSPALAVEADQPTLFDRPRLVLKNRRAGGGRMNQFILAINRLGGATTLND